MHYVALCIISHRGRGLSVVHISADKDMWQLVQPHVYVTDLKAK